MSTSLSTKSFILCVLRDLEQSPEAVSNAWVLSVSVSKVHILQAHRMMGTARDLYNLNYIPFLTKLLLLLSHIFISLAVAANASVVVMARVALQHTRTRQ